MANTKYPEHEKLVAIDADRAVVQRFIDWMFDDREWALCAWGEPGDYRPIYRSRAEIIGLFFNINSHTLELEKRAMLDELRAMNQELNVPD